MKKALLLLLIAVFLLLAAACVDGGKVLTEETTTEPLTGEAEETAEVKETTEAEETTEEVVAVGLSSNEAIKALREEIWNEYVAELPASRATELVANGIGYVTIGARKMKVETKVVGSAPKDGYPIFIVLHGGGSDPTGEINESQWSGMAGRYSANKVAGIYVSCRAIEDTWNCHSVDNAYKFYDRIIENATVYMNGNPNKAYIVGYSAGGDGVYQIATRMSDRFAAANMTAGHPNGVSMVNVYNMAFFLQVGELDTAYNRHTETVKYSQLLDALAEQYGGGYTHAVFVHSGKEHGVVGDNQRTKQLVVDDTDAWLASGGKAGTGGTVYATTHAASLMNAYTRDPIPTRVVWDLSTRTPSVRKVNAFYWLSAPSSVRDGILDITYDKETNTVRVNSCTVTSPKAAKFTVYLSEDMLDLFSEITFDFCGKVTTFTPVLSEELIRTTTEERGDPNFQFVSSFTFDLEGNVES